MHLHKRKCSNHNLFTRSAAHILLWLLERHKLESTRAVQVVLVRLIRWISRRSTSRPMVGRHKAIFFCCSTQPFGKDCPVSITWELGVSHPLFLCSNIFSFLFGHIIYSTMSHGDKNNYEQEHWLKHGFEAGASKGSSNQHPVERFSCTLLPFNSIRRPISNSTVHCRDWPSHRSLPSRREN